MEIKKKTALLRWSVLIVVIVHILYVNLFHTEEKEIYVTEKYKSLFVPAGYAFSIWLLIYIALIIYSVYQLLAAQREKALYNQVALPFMISVTLGIWWSIVYGLEFVGISFISITGMLIFAYVVYREIHMAILHKECPKWILMPFSLLLGWLTVASVSNFTIWLVSIGANNSFLSEVVMTRFIVIGILILAISFSAKYWDFVFPLTVTWGLTGLYIARNNDNSPIATPAFICSLVLIVWSLIVVFFKKSPYVGDLRR